MGMFSDSFLTVLAFQTTEAKRSTFTSIRFIRRTCLPFRMKLLISLWILDDLLSIITSNCLMDLPMSPEPRLRPKLWFVCLTESPRLGSQLTEWCKMLLRGTTHFFPWCKLIWIMLLKALSLNFITADITVRGQHKPAASKLSFIHDSMTRSKRYIIRNRKTKLSLLRHQKLCGVMKTNTVAHGLATVLWG